MAKNRHRLQSLNKKQYTFTNTKAAIGFVISAVFSIFFSHYFEKHGALIFDQTVQAFKVTFGIEAQAEE